MLSDILPTGFEIGGQYGHVKPGDVLAVIGAGPVGLAVIATAGLCGAAVDQRLTLIVGFRRLVVGTTCRWRLARRGRWSGGDVFA